MDQKQEGNGGAKETKLDCCQHTFCLDCIKKWLTMNHSQQCPQCRKPIKKITYKEEAGKAEKTEEI